MNRTVRTMALLVSMVGMTTGLLMALTLTGPARRTTLTISAAASMTDAAHELADAFEAEHPGTKVELNLGATGTLKTQILQGAPAEVFIGASEKHTDDLRRAGRLAGGRYRILCRNGLALVVPSSSSILPGAGWDVLDQRTTRRVAIGEPSYVPAGRYAVAWLKRQGRYARLADRFVHANTVRQALAWVEAGEVDAGIVFATDARMSQRVRVVASAGPEVFEEIRYTIAVTELGAGHPVAEAFLEMATGPTGQAILTGHGFVPVAR